MSRILVVIVLLVGLTAIASGPPVRSPVAKADAPAKPIAPAKPVAAKAAPGSTQALVETLLKPVSYAGEDDPRRTLAEALDTLAKRYNFSYAINERAFKFEMINEAGKTEIAQPPLPTMKAPLCRVIARILNRIPVPSGATFLVREDGIEITTQEALSREIPIERNQTPPARPAAGIGGVPPGMGLGGALGGGGALGAFGGGGALGALGGGGMLGGVGGPVNPLDGSVDSLPKKVVVPVVSVAVENQPFEAAIRQIRTQANTNLVLDPSLAEKTRTSVTITLLNAPLDSAMRVLTETVELDFVWLDNIFYITTRDKAQKLRTVWPARRSGGEAQFRDAGGAAAGM